MDHAPTPWEQIPTLADEMAELLRDGNSAAQTAEALNQRHNISLSRSAVMGKAHRLKVRWRPNRDTRGTTRLKIEHKHIVFLRKIAIAKQPPAAALVAFEAEYGVRYSLSWLRALARKHNIPFRGDNGWQSGAATAVKKKNAAKISRRAIDHGRRCAEDQAGPEPTAITPHKGLFEIGRNECRWPHGDPAGPDFHFCAHVTSPGRPYCRHHMARAYAAGGGE